MFIYSPFTTPLLENLRAAKIPVTGTGQGSDSSKKVQVVSFISGNFVQEWKDNLSIKTTASAWEILRRRCRLADVDWREELVASGLRVSFHTELAHPKE